MPDSSSPQPESAPSNPGNPTQPSRETNPSNQGGPPPPAPAGPPALVKISVARSGTPTFCLTNNPPNVWFDGETFVVRASARFKFFFWNQGHTPTGVSFNQTQASSQPDPAGDRNMIDRRPDSDPAEPGKRMFGVTDAHIDGTDADPSIWKLFIAYTDDKGQAHTIDPEIANTDGNLTSKLPPPP